MTIRYLVWHIPNPGAKVPSFYADKDCEPIALRIHAGTVPRGGDMVVDVLDDGVSIMKSNDYQKWTFKDEDAYIFFNSPTGTFTYQEVVTGGTSNATARVKVNAFGKLTLYDVSGVFTSGETITGGTSSATGVVGTFVRQVKNSTMTTVAGRSHAILPKGATSDNASANFKQGVQIQSGSWVSLSILEENGASNVTVQLELEALSESEELKRWAD